MQIQSFPNARFLKYMQIRRWIIAKCFSDYFIPVNMITVLLAEFGWWKQADAERDHSSWHLSKSCHVLRLFSWKARETGQWSPAQPKLPWTNVSGIKTYNIIKGTLWAVITYMYICLCAYSVYVYALWPGTVWNWLKQTCNRRWRSIFLQLLSGPKSISTPLHRPGRNSWLSDCEHYSLLLYE